MKFIFCNNSILFLFLVLTFYLRRKSIYLESKLYPQWHSFTFMVLEKKPKNSEHPQGDRVLDCLSFSTQGLKIKGQARFDEFETILSIPQDGSLDV